MKTMHKTRSLALGTLSVLTVATLLPMATPAHAGSKGKRNTAIGLGAVTAYGLLKGKKTVAVVGGVGTAVAYSKYRKSKKSEERRRQEWYQNRYGKSWRNHYKSGT